MTVQIQWPERDTAIEFTLVTRGITIPSHVEASSSSGLVLRPHLSAFLRKIAVQAGEPVEVYWQGPDAEQALPAEISEIEAAAERLFLTPTGPARRSQRRKAVRAAMELPVLIKVGGLPLFGHTVDLSEAGMRALVDGWGLPPEPGASVEVDLTLDDTAPPVDPAVVVDAAILPLEGVIVRQRLHRARWELSLQFTGVPEAVEDRLRRRVFRALREERARADE
jgi:c-di-GMP-binding flagellar brake protein YcgR